MDLNYDPAKRFGRYLVALRKERGISQERLAAEAGVGRSYMSRVERGLVNVALPNLCKLARALQVPPPKLLEFSHDAEDGDES